MKRVLKCINQRSGLSLVEVILAIGMIGMLFGAIYVSYFSIVDVIDSSSFRAQAASLLNQEIEIIRNLPFDEVGVEGSIPAGILPPLKTVSGNDGHAYGLEFTVRNIDDPFDGTIGGSPNDTAPADYKLVEIKASCLSCPRFVPISITTTVAPPGLESASSDGSLFVNVFDASAQGVSNATVRVVNASTTPTIDLTDTTNASGVLQLVGVPTSTQGYFIQISKSGYSSERTYAIGDASNPSPLPQYTHATVQAQTLTTASFSIDELSSLELIASDKICQPFSGEEFAARGSKLIGTPSVYKNSYNETTDSDGVALFSNIEWDTYNLTHTTSSYVISGISPFGQVVVNPDTASSIRYTLDTVSNNALLVRVKNVANNDLASSSITISRSSFSASATTSRATLSETDWFSYDSQSGGVLVAPTSLALILNASGTYDTGEEEWLISDTIDFGATSTFYAFSWNPGTQPPQTGAASLKFQLASNNDNATWNFIGPDGTSGTYYSSPDGTIHSGHSGHRYLRYRAYLATQDENYTPQLDDVSFIFSGPCMPRGQILFSGLSSNDYEVAASAPGYITATTSVTVSDPWQSVELQLTAS